MVGLRAGVGCRSRGSVRDVDRLLQGLESCCGCCNGLWMCDLRRTAGELREAGFRRRECGWRRWCCGLEVYESMDCFGSARPCRSKAQPRQSRPDQCHQQGSQATREHGDARQQLTCVSAPRPMLQTKIRKCHSSSPQGCQKSLIVSLRRLHISLNTATFCSRLQRMPCPASTFHARNCTIFTR